MKISNADFLKLLSEEIGQNEKITGIHLIGLISEINQKVDDGEEYNIAGFGTFTKVKSLLAFTPDDGFAKEINYKYEGMPPIDVDAAKAVVDEEPGKQGLKPAKTRKTDTIIVDEAVAGEPDENPTSKKLASEAVAKKDQKQIPMDTISKDSEKKETPSENVSKENQPSDFKVDMDAVTGALEINSSKKDVSSDESTIIKPQKKDISDPFAEVIKSGSISILNNEDGIVEQSLSEAKRAREEKDKAEAARLAALAESLKKGTPRPPPPSPVKKVKVGAIKGKTQREFIEMVPPQPPAAIEIEASSEVHPKAESKVSEPLNYDFQPPQESIDDSASDLTTESVKERPLPGDRRKDKSSTGIMLAAVAVVLIAILTWWFITDRSGVEPTSGELPVAGISQSMIDEVPQMEESASGTGDEIVFEQDIAQEIEIDGALITVEESTIEPVRSQPSTATSPSSNGFGLRGDTQPMDGRVFSIIVHSLPNRSEGNLQCNEIAALDLRCVVVEATANDQTTFRVGIGQFQTYAEAQRRVNDLPEPYRSRNFPARIN